MRTSTSQNLVLYTTFILLLSTFAAAWPWPRFLPEIDALIVRRQDEGSSSSAQPTAKASASTAEPTGSAKPSGSGSATASPSKPTGSNTASQTGSKTGSQTGSQTGSASTRKPSQTGKPKYDPRLPPGGISMLTPAATVTSPFYKIGDYVTFGFNYTSLSSTPTALNIYASCTSKPEYHYEVASNYTTGGTKNGTDDAEMVVWDTSKHQALGQQALVLDTYTLVIYDADGNDDDTPVAGYLAPFKGFKFGMYAAQDYSDSTDGEPQCATCSGAGMVGASVLSVLIPTAMMVSAVWFV